MPAGCDSALVYLCAGVRACGRADVRACRRADVRACGRLDMRVTAYVCACDVCMYTPR